MNLNREDLTIKISKKIKVRQEDIAKIINSLLEEIVEQTQIGNTIELREFGTFYSYFKKSRIYIIPRLKKKCAFKGYVTLKFKPSRQLRLYKE